VDVVEGTLFAGYRIERRLSGDSLGTVYLAQHPRLPRKDALKILSDAHAHDADFRARFLREAEVAGRVQHPNVLAVRDCGAQDGRLWIAMQYVDGVDVGGLIRRGRSVLDTERAVWIVGEAARGLDEIHRAALLHRDIKPDSIIVAEQQAAPDRVFVADFGIARAADDATTLAGGGGMPTTVAYAAPEQISGDAVDDRADVYSLGCTLYHMLTGSVPFSRDSPGAVMYAHLNEPPPQPSRANPLVPTAFDAVIAKAMAKNRGERYPSCGALATAAKAALLPTPQPAVVASAAGPNKRRRRGPLLGAVAVVIALVAVLVSAIHRVGRDDPAATGPATSTDRAAAASAAAWSPHAAVFEAFSRLLPATPLGIGYRELNNCRFTDYRGDPISFDATGPLDRLECVGDQDPMELVSFTCNTTREPIGAAPRSEQVERLEGEERWTKPSGVGMLRWGTFTNLHGQSIGELEVSFESSNRNHCRMHVVGGSSGADLRARWWVDAPL